MAEINILFDRKGNSLDVWFGEPREAMCEETEEEFIVKKDLSTGEVIGFEKFNITFDEIPEVKFLVQEKAKT